MKYIISSPEVFNAYAAIDFAYAGLEDLQNELAIPVPTINAMVDKATGYDKIQNKKTIKTAISLIETVIKNKKIIEADYSGDEKFLNELKSLTPSNQPTEK